MSWYERTYRKLFFDFHSRSQTVGLASNFNAERWAERLWKVGCEAASVFIKGGHGWSSYRKGKFRYVHPELSEDIDMLEKQIEALHKRGIKVIGYYHTFGSEPIAAEHPEWIEKDKDGKPRGTSICLLSPVFKEWMLPQVEEVVKNYDVDSMFFDGTFPHGPCYCRYCRKRFQNDVGLEIPKDEKDPHWRKYVSGKMEMFRDIREQICDTIHQIRPEVVVSANWAYTLRQIEVVPEGIGALVADIFPDDQVFNGSYLSKYWVTLNKPFDIMNTAFLQWWGDWGCKPVTALKQEVATILANGGKTWIGYQMDHTFDVQPAVMGELGKALSFVKEREYLFHNAEPVPYIGIFVSTKSNEVQASFRNDETALRGIHRILNESSIPHHFVHEKRLKEDIDKYSAIIIPDQRYIDSELAVCLRKYVREGGVVVATALSGTLNKDFTKRSNFILQDLFGISLEGKLEESHAYIKVKDDRLAKNTLDMPHLVEGEFFFVKPQDEDVEILANLYKPYLGRDGKYLLRWSPVGEDSGYPAITLKRFGKGYASYIAGQIFRGYQVKNQWNLKHIVANLLSLTIQKKLVEVESHPWAEVVLCHRDNETIVHFINHHGDRPVDGNNLCIEEIPPIRDIKVKLRINFLPQKVTLEPGGIKLDVSYSNGILAINVPEIYIHSAIVIR